MADKLNIKDWAAEDRPREKMVSKGASALSNAELLAILIGSGSSEDSAVTLMRKVLASCGDSLGRLARMSVEELCEVKGIGPAMAITILAACELGRRRATEDVERTVVTRSKDVYEMFRHRCRDLATEECHVMLLNTASRIIDTQRISFGGQTETIVDIREVLRLALLQRATAIILVHNHPSGNTRPSRHDDQLTARLKEAAHVMNITLVDHIIVGENSYYSYSDEGKL